MKAMTLQEETAICDRIAYSRESVWFMRDFDKIATDMGFVRLERKNPRNKSEPRCNYFR